jgi:hypothetical protein
MRIAIRRHEEAGNHAVARELCKIADTWERIGARAREEEDRRGDGD